MWVGLGRVEFRIEIASAIKKAAHFCHDEANGSELFKPFSDFVRQNAGLIGSNSDTTVETQLNSRASRMCLSY